MQNIFVEFLPPWIETGLQPAFYDKESGTVLQQVARMYAKVNWLIKIFNDFSKDTADFVNDFVESTNTEITRFENSTTETVNDYIARFVALKDYVDDYFDNLDVQEEINNKLDDMTEDGTLQEIIANYLNSRAVFGYDTLADLKSATNLIDGSFAETLGYHAKNDGGGALYKIRYKIPEESTDNGSVIRLDNFATTNLVAELIPGRQVTPNHFGAYGDGIHDDILACRACHNYAIDKNIEMGGVRRSIYGISEPLQLLLNGYDFNNATFKALNTMSEVILFHPFRSSSAKIPNEYLKNIIVDCDGKADYGIHLDQGGGITYVNNVNIINHLEIGFYISYGSVRLLGCKIEQRDLTRHSVGFQTDGWDSELTYITTKNCTTGIKVTSEGNTLTSCHPSMFEPALIPGSRGFDLYAYTSLVNCVPDTYQYGVYINHAYGLTAVNCHCIIEPTYYNVEDVPDTIPYFFYTGNTSNTYNEGITIVGCWLQHNIYDNDVIHFTNFPQWTGSSIRLNNPKLNDNSDYLKYLPSEIKQHRSNSDLSSYIQGGATFNTARINTNGNMCELKLIELTLPAINAGTEYKIVDGLPDYLKLSSDCYKTVTTDSGVICSLSFRSAGSIRITPLTGAIANNDTIKIDEIFLK